MHKHKVLLFDGEKLTWWKKGKFSSEVNKLVEDAIGMCGWQSPYGIKCFSKRLADTHVCRIHTPTYIPKKSGWSKYECRTIDALEIELGRKIQHIHCTNEPNEARGEEPILEGWQYRIPGTRRLVDGWDMVDDVYYDYLGSFGSIHSDPTKQLSAKTMNGLTNGQLAQRDYNRFLEIHNATHRPIYYIFSTDVSDYTERGGRLTDYLRRFDPNKPLFDPVPDVHIKNKN